MTLTASPVPEPDRFRALWLADEPSPAELAAIDAEWPLIAAELDLVDAEIRALSAEGGPSPLDRRRLRRAEHRVMRTAAEQAALSPDGGCAA